MLQKHDLLLTYVSRLTFWCLSAGLADATHKSPSRMKLIKYGHPGHTFGSRHAPPGLDAVTSCGVNGGVDADTVNQKQGWRNDEV